MQLKKLAVISNVCFWLTLLFQVWREARFLNQQLLNTIVIIGIFALLVNVIWLTTFIQTQRKNQSLPGKNSDIRVNKKVDLLFFSFNILSFAAQTILLSIKYL